MRRSADRRMRLLVLTVALALGTLVFATPPEGFYQLVESLRKEVGDFNYDYQDLLFRPITANK